MLIEVRAASLNPVDGKFRAFELDVIFDVLGLESELKSIAQVKRGGAVVGISGMPDPHHPMLPWWARPAVALRTRARAKAAQARDVRFAYIFMRPDGKELEEIAAWVDAGKLRAVIHQIFPLADFQQAFAVVESGRARGKVVVTI